MNELKIDMNFLESRPLSYSSLKNFLKSPQHYIQYITEKKEPTAAMIFGSLVDCLLLTPDDFENQFAVLPEINRHTNEGKAQYAALQDAAQGKTLIDAETLTQAQDLITALNNNASVKSYLDRVEKTQVKFNFEIDGLPFVSKLDIIGDTFICDFKTAASAEPNSFTKSALNFDYDLQAAIYLKAVKKEKVFPDYFWIAAEKDKPFACSVIKADADFLEFGQKKLEKGIENFKYCMRENLFNKSYDFWTASGIFFAELPNWLKNKED